MVQPSVEEPGQRLLRGFDVVSARHGGNEACALLLRLALRAAIRMPLAFALTRFGIGDVENDRPAAGRALAEVAFHFGLLPRAVVRSGSLRAVAYTRPSARPTFRTTIPPLSASSQRALMASTPDQNKRAAPCHRSTSDIQESSGPGLESPPWPKEQQFRTTISSTQPPVRPPLILPGQCRAKAVR